MFLTLSQLIGNLAMINEIEGGILIGSAATLLWLGIGRFSGITGIVSGLFSLHEPRRYWTVWFLVGLVLANPLFRLGGGNVTIHISQNLSLWLAGGLLVGFGTYIGNGCTSGHGVCGLSRLSLRSVVATLTFITTGIITVAIMNGVAAL